MTPKLQLSRQIDMYGVCNRINAYAGSKTFARAVCDPVYLKSWGVSVYSVDGTVTDYEIAIGDDAAAAIEHVVAVISLSFRSNFAQRVAA